MNCLTLICEDESFYTDDQEDLCTSMKSVIDNLGRGSNAATADIYLYGRHEVKDKMKFKFICIWLKFF